MTEPPAAARSGTAAAERDDLLATKLHVPGPRPGFVPRPRLAQRLDEGLGQGLILVCAPAGSGKTVLLADWARLGRSPAAWLSLDAGDNDPARFWRHALAALDHVCPGIGERVSPLLGPPAPVSFEGLVTALINELAAGPGADERPLVLDDYHLIVSQPVHASLGFLLEHRRPGLGVVLASRADPVGAGNAVTAVDLVLRSGPVKTKFGIWLREAALSGTVSTHVTTIRLSCGAPGIWLARVARPV